MFQFLSQVRNDGVIETRLYMRKTTKESFRKYTLHAENAIATSRTEAELKESTYQKNRVERFKLILFQVESKSMRLHHSTSYLNLLK